MIRHNKCDGCCCGSISPVKATPDMTQPVGIRRNQLYTTPSLIPEFDELNEGDVLRVVDGVAQWDPGLKTAESELTTQASLIAALNQSKQTKAVVKNITIPFTSWATNVAIVPVSGITADDLLIVAPDPDYFDAWNASSIRATEQAANLLTLRCVETPTTDIDALVIVWR